MVLFSKSLRQRLIIVYLPYKRGNTEWFIDSK